MEEIDIKKDFVDIVSRNCRTSTWIKFGVETEISEFEKLVVREIKSRERIIRVVL